MARRELKSGFTTGTAAAAAAKAAVMLAFGQSADQVEVSLPEGGKVLSIPVAVAQRKKSGHCEAVVVKDAGDDPDVTNKARIKAEVQLLPAEADGACLEICGGQGVGLVTKAGLAVEPGKPAINPVPREMICRAVRQALAWVAPEEHFAVKVTISVDEGERLARYTLNPRLGVMGGISILGTSGLVKPFSHEAYTQTIDVALSVAQAAGHQEVVLTTGGKSEKRAMILRPDLNSAAFVQIADFFAYSLRACAQAGMHRVGLVSFFGKAVKQAAGMEYTHAHKAAMDLPRLAQWLGGAGLETGTCQEIAQANTARHALDILRLVGRLALVSEVGKRMLASAREFAGPSVDIWAIIIDYNGAGLYGGNQPAVSS
ncbi:MAG: cobalt-precorrin-5B (C(1))-methyltransferase CbiD [Deltaproteobacteria bacterium]|nr:cobalt-precorrin-5B (C(1))-methyltransferase CbiD [Deltaproteobacteria bacterium]